jgi:hypothetical protein
MLTDAPGAIMKARAHLAVQHVARRRAVDADDLVPRLKPGLLGESSTLPVGSSRALP